jgi:hypothetical protein
MTSTRSALCAMGFIVCVFICHAADAQLSDRQLSETFACGIQQALLKSPGQYVIAVVEHPGRVYCDENGCVESLKVVKLFASRTFSGHRYTDATVDIEASRDAQTMPRGFRSFVVATPVQRSGQYYLPITHGPVDLDDERAEQAAVKLAFGPPIGELCKKTLPASFRILKAKE